MREQLTPDDELGPAVRTLGFSPADVRWAVLTHLHTDHAGGLEQAVDLGDRLVLLAGDASYTEQLMLDGRADGVTNDVPTARRTLVALRALAEQRPTVYLPSHDPRSRARLAAMQSAAG